MNDIDKLKIPDWGKYIPLELDYESNTDRQDLLCRFKLYQVYQDLCLARMNFIFADRNTNYGDLNINDKNKNMLEKYFLQNSLLYYNFCIDLSWSMIYFYYVSKNEEKFNISIEEIEKLELNVNFDSLQELFKMQLNITSGNKKNDLEKIIIIVTEFWNKKIPENFRQEYNFLKHRGVFDILGINSNEAKIFLFENHKIEIDIPKLKKMDVLEIRKMLIKFHNLFTKYIDDIIEILILPNYKESTYSFKEVLENIINNSSKKEDI